MLNSISMDLRNCRIYVGLFPCNECTKVIIQAGIKEIIYLSDKYSATDQIQAAKIMLDKCPAISYRQLTTSLKELTVNFVPPEL